MKKKYITVIIYARVSSDEQKNNTSLDFQEEQLRDYCKKMGYTVIAVYREDYSAKDPDLKRPEMKAIYQYCKSHKGEVDKILFYRWDRYARNVEFALTYKRKFMDELEVEINAIESPIDFHGTEWATMLSIYCGVAHTEDLKISRRTKDGIRATLKAGRYPQKAPIGYLNHRISDSETHLIIDEKYAPVVAEVFRELAKGLDSIETLWRKYGPMLIRRKGIHKDRQGIAKDTTNHPISKGAFFRMVRNRLYCGEIVVPAYMDEPEEIIIGEHEPIISKATFLAAQDAIDVRTQCKPHVRKTDKPELFLRRYLVCPLCGYAITGGISTGHGGKYAYYNCCHCKRVKSRAEKANDAFADFIRGLQPTPATQKAYEEIVMDFSEKGKEARKIECENIQTQISSIDGKIAVADDKMLDGGLDMEQYQRVVERLNSEKQKLTERLEVLKKPRDTKIEPKLTYAYSLIDSMVYYVREAPVEVRCHLIGSIFPEKIEFDGEKYRTSKMNEVATLIFQSNNELEKQKQGLESTKPRSVPRVGLEPTQPFRAKGFSYKPKFAWTMS